MVSEIEVERLREKNKRQIEEILHILIRSEKIDKGHAKRIYKELNENGCAKIVVSNGIKKFSVKKLNDTLLEVPEDRKFFEAHIGMLATPLRGDAYIIGRTNDPPYYLKYLKIKDGEVSEKVSIIGEISERISPAQLLIIPRMYEFELYNIGWTEVEIELPGLEDVKLLMASVYH